MKSLILIMVLILSVNVFGLEYIQVSKIYYGAESVVIIEIEGHQYIDNTSGDAGGICHSASCPKCNIIKMHELSIKKEILNQLKILNKRK